MKKRLKPALPSPNPTTTMTKTTTTMRQLTSTMVKAMIMTIWETVGAVVMVVVESEQEGERGQGA